MNEEDDLLNFNYPLIDNELIELETKVKQTLRDISYNIPIDRDIPRYSDKYISYISYSDIVNTLNIELAGPELLRNWNTEYNIEVINVEVDENSEEHVVEEGSAEDDSLQGGDDYAGNYYDDEIVDEPEDREATY